MGLAASQARFLGITLRKANCEFKSTELAQQRLELTNQMTNISQEYANALNSTKLIWHNELVCDSFGNPSDMGLSYGLLMMPSAANDYNPYMVSTKSGAIVLSAKYADAAEYAGISMAGGVPSESGRNKFIEALANKAAPNNPRTSLDKNNNIITEATYEALVEDKNNLDVKWHYSAGMGAIPKNKMIADTVTIDDLKMDKSIGKVNIDWLQIVRGLSGVSINEAMTDVQSERVTEEYNNNIIIAKMNYSNYLNSSDSSNSLNDSLEMNKLINEITAYAKKDNTITIEKADTSIIDKFNELQNIIKNTTNEVEKTKYTNELENLKKGLDKDGKQIDGNNGEYLYPLYWAIYEKVQIEQSMQGSVFAWNGSDYAANNPDAYLFNFDELFQTADQIISNQTFRYQTPKTDTSGKILKDSEGNIEYEYKNIRRLTLVQNDVICKDENQIKGLTISDLLSRNITIMAWDPDGKDGFDEEDKIYGINSINTVSTVGKYLLEYIASIFGYGHIGTGINVDEASNAALNMAFAMVEKKFLNPANVVDGGEGYNPRSMSDNAAYVNANNYNRIGANIEHKHASLNISNMLSAFLTYYDNYLRGADSAYIVGKDNSDGRTVFVTDDPNYAYVTNTKEKISNAEKIADFYNELYNNICEHGWRYDDMVIDNEYLESAVKDGRYQLMALNGDGYFYQERYNDIGYLEEVTDDDAIARAEVDFTTKKAQITYKEDQIDLKTKKLDAEISELNTEINSVQNIISKSIEKTFTMFSN